MEKHNFLKQKYDLHNTPEVKSAVDRTEIRIEEKVPQNPDDQIQTYLDRFKEITDHKDLRKRERGMKALKSVLRAKFVIKPEEIPESAFLLEQRIARELGHGDVEITDEFKKQKISEIINNQRQSLDKWINYLSLDDAQYPDWAKYWTFRSMLEMGKLQKKDEHGKEIARFQKRDKDTVASFPPMNPRALAMTISTLQARLAEKDKPKKDRKLIKNQSVKLNDIEFQNLASTESFSKIYTQFLIELPEYSAEGLQEIKGEWTKYPQGSDPKPLVQSLEGYPLEWCTANIDTARTQLQGGDFYVYYSLNQDGQPTIPRIAIRMQDNSIAEVRGIAPDQNLDPYIAPVVEEKMKEFPDGEKYEKKSKDMKLLTVIENKVNKGESLNKNELVFLYEFNAPIEGFGYPQDGKCSDPRVNEIRSLRTTQDDASVIFECKPEDVVFSSEDVTENTKVYIGELFPSIFQKKIEHIFVSFPERKIEKYDIEIGGKTKEEYATELKEKNIDVGEYSQYQGQESEYHSISKDLDFVTSETKENVNIVIVKPSELGIGGDVNGEVTTEEIVKKAYEYGLELCHSEVGPEFRLRYLGDNLEIIIRKQITGKEDGYFHDTWKIYRKDDKLKLDTGFAKPWDKFKSNYNFIFRLTKKT